MVFPLLLGIITTSTQQNGENKMYEWETELDQDAIECNKACLRSEIKRISTVTLRGNFVRQEDRDFWVKRLESLNCRLSALESH